MTDAYSTVAEQQAGRRNHEPLTKKNLMLHPLCELHEASPLARPRRDLSASRQQHKAKHNACCHLTLAPHAVLPHPHASVAGRPPASAWHDSSCCLRPRLVLHRKAHFELLCHRRRPLAACFENDFPLGLPSVFRIVPLTVPIA